MSLFLRHMLWTTLCPGMVTIVLPGVIVRDVTFNGIHFHWWHIPGVLMILGGASILLSCIFMFGKFGKGTLSPFDPARHLVIKGLYRYMRNPMYVGVIIILLGEALFFGSTMMVIYALCAFVMFNVFILFYEEPYLRKEFGVQYDDYKKQVGRWIPRKL